jgi:hypothetical protein
VVLRAIPLCPGGVRTGALVLVRDVTSCGTASASWSARTRPSGRSTTGVKNHLQTVAALLRLQGRRAVEPETRAALEEAVRRWPSIAVVHETLSGGLEQDVDFDVIADRLTASLSDVAVPAAGRWCADREASGA